MKLDFDILYRPKCLSLGIDIGNNYKENKKWKNIFLEVSFLFWTFGIELIW